MFEKIGKGVVAILWIALAIVVSGILVGFPVKWLWNWLLSDLFDFKQINFWQAWGLVALCHLLFTSSTSAKRGTNP